MDLLLDSIEHRVEDKSRRPMGVTIRGGRDDVHSRRKLSHKSKLKANRSILPGTQNKLSLVECHATCNARHRHDLLGSKVQHLQTIEIRGSAQRNVRLSRFKSPGQVDAYAGNGLSLGFLKRVSINSKLILVE